MRTKNSRLRKAAAMGVLVLTLAGCSESTSCVEVTDYKRVCTGRVSPLLGGTQCIDGNWVKQAVGSHVECYDSEGNLINK